MAMRLPLPPDNKLEEWKECRGTIDRFDKIIVDIRKYGFTVITGLITANALLFVKISESSPIEKAVVSTVTMALLFVLFVIDRQHEILLRGAVKRAEEVELILGFRLTTKIDEIAENARAGYWSLIIYIGFTLISAAPAFASTVKFSYYPDSHRVVLWWVVWLMSCITLVFLVAILVYHHFTKKW